MRIDPAKTPIYHITHIRNLPSIVRAGCLISDARRRAGEFDCTNIGHMHIKDRRMHRPVPVAAKGILAITFPSNFCVRSVMLSANLLIRTLTATTANSNRLSIYARTLPMRSVAGTPGHSRIVTQNCVTLLSLMT